MDYDQAQVFSLEGVDPFLCHCLGLTEEELRQACSRWNITSLKDLSRLTGAGDGCMACHRRLKELLDEETHPSPSSSPIFSAR